MTVNEYNYAQLSQTAKALAETVRHNKASEAVEQGKLAETQRHQMASESISRGQLDESVRHDSAMESIQRQSNYISDWYNKTRSTQEDAKIAQSGLSTSANVSKTNAETSWMNRMNEAEVYSKYTNANASAEKSAAYTRNAATNEFNAKINAVLNTGKWITGTLTDLGGMLTKGGLTKAASNSSKSTHTSQSYKESETELKKYLESKGYWG